MRKRKSFSQVKDYYEVSRKLNSGNIHSKLSRVMAERRMTVRTSFSSSQHASTLRTHSQIA